MGRVSTAYGAMARWARVNVPRGRRLQPGSWLAVLIALTALIWYLSTILSLRLLPLAAQVIPVLAATTLLHLRQLRMLLLAVAVAIAGTLIDLGYTATRMGSVVVVAVATFIVYRTILGRERLGLVGTRSDAILAELRDRLAPRSGVPNLPADWHAETDVRSAGGTSFGGDFFVAAVDDNHLEIALVDVSGKGLAAGTRALQLSGALGGLLSAASGARFLPEANRYLLRQDWAEGFATAVHVSVELDTGAFDVFSAGHPPAASFRAGSGLWELLDADGPALGLLPDAAYCGTHGTLQHGDALMFYTDGLVEVSGRDLSVGIDRLLGEANRLILGGFAGGTGRLLAAVPDVSDDRAIVLLWRA